MRPLAQILTETTANWQWGLWVFHTPRTSWKTRGHTPHPSSAPSQLGTPPAPRGLQLSICIMGDRGCARPWLFGLHLLHVCEQMEENRGGGGCSPQAEAVRQTGSPRPLRAAEEALKAMGQEVKRGSGKWGEKGLEAADRGREAEKWR